MSPPHTYFNDKYTLLWLTIFCFNVAWDRTENRVHVIWIRAIWNAAVAKPFPITHRMRINKSSIVTIYRLHFQLSLFSTIQTDRCTLLYRRHQIENLITELIFSDVFFVCHWTDKHFIFHFNWIFVQKWLRCGKKYCGIFFVRVKKYYLLTLSNEAELLIKCICTWSMFDVVYTVLYGNCFENFKVFLYNFWSIAVPKTLLNGTILFL